MRNLARAMVIVMLGVMLSPAFNCAGPFQAPRMAMTCCKSMHNACRANQSEGQWDCCQHAPSLSRTASLTLPQTPVDGQVSLALVSVLPITVRTQVLTESTNNLTVSRRHPPPHLAIFVLQGAFRI